VIPSLAHAQTLLRSAPGPTAGAQFGRSCIVVPDQNGDGFKDLLVGAPNFNAQRGAVYCVSGGWFASGAGTSILWSIAPATNAGDQFGFALENVGDVTNDGVVDFLVGVPGFDGTGSNVGAVRLINGATHTVGPEIVGLSSGSRTGTSIALCGDLTGDGKREVAVGAPGPTASGSLLYILKSFALAGGGQINFSTTYATFYSNSEYATSLASGFDYDGDGFEELVVGVPGADNGLALDAGAVFMESPGASTPSFASYVSPVAGERLGQSLSIGGDYDGDGAPDIVVGAPNSPDTNGYQVGRVVVLSGRRLFFHTPPYEIYSFPFGAATPPANHTDPNPNFHFGAAVIACADLNGDGVGEILAGAPDFFSPGFPSGWSFRGLVRIFSGATGTQLAQITGGTTDRLGDAFGGAIGDLDGDGFKEFALAGSLSDVGGVDSGVVKAYRLFPIAPVGYCTGKVNSLGCTPSIFSSGAPSASSTSPFLIQASNLVNQKNGLLFYSHRPNAAVFQGGTKCVAEPTIRTPSQSSGGAATGASCTGAFSFDFNDWTQNGPDVSLVAGTEIYAQYWSRDPQSPSHTSLSNALRFLVNP